MRLIDPYGELIADSRWLTDNKVKISDQPFFFGEEIHPAPPEPHNEEGHPREVSICSEPCGASSVMTIYSLGYPTTTNGTQETKTLQRKMLKNTGRLLVAARKR